MAAGIIRQLKSVFTKSDGDETAYERGLMRGEAMLAASQYARRHPMKEFSAAMADVRPVSWAVDVAHDILAKPDRDLFRSIRVVRGKGKSGRSAEYAISDGGWTLTVSDSRKNKGGFAAAYITDPSGREISLAASEKTRTDGDARLLAAALGLTERYEEETGGLKQERSTARVRRKR